MNTVRSAYGMPEGVGLRVIEADAATTCIVIPRRPKDWPSDISASDALARLKSVFRPLSDGISAAADGVLGLIAQAMADEKYAATLIASPESVMQKAGVDVAKGVKITVVQETESEIVVIIPSSKPRVVLTDDELDRTAVLLQDSLHQLRMTTGSWPFSCSNPPTWCPYCAD